MDKSSYIKALQTLGFRFPETIFIDSDHAFLAPTRGEVNIGQVSTLIESGIIDEEFALDVLSIDFERPLFSEIRCSLLNLVPETGPIMAQFKAGLSKIESAHAKKLLQDLEIENREAHRQKARAYLFDKQKAWMKHVNILKELTMLNQLRASVFDDVQ